jgi:RHS repeat-associated protein
VPENWVQRPVVNTEEGSNPGAPLAWGSPENPDDAVAGYGYVPCDTSEVEETFYYHSDHLGSTAYITDQQANVTQYDAYLPYGELLVDEHSSSADLPYKFNGKELDEETGLYYYGARYMNPIASIWYGVDPLAEKYVLSGSYVYCLGNPVKLVDPDGKSAKVIKDDKTHTITISAHFIFYGEAASQQLATETAKDIQDLWNGANGTVKIKNITYNVNFKITAEYRDNSLGSRIKLKWQKTFENNPENNYVEVKNYVNDGTIEGVSCMHYLGNTGVFQLNNIKGRFTTTEAHEFGHSLGLWPSSDGHHPKINQRGKGQPGIMCPRGTLVDPQYQYDPKAKPGRYGGTLNPEKRRVIQSDIDALHLENLNYDKNGISQIGRCL